MERFTYVRAGSVAEALALLAEPGVHSRLLAGGTDLLLLARQDPQCCDRVIDISLIPELHATEQQGERVTIGAGATFSEVLEHPAVTATAPLLAEACRQVGAVQIRNMGTLGGNVANAAACADSLPALVCLDAVAHLATPTGEQTMPVADLIVAPNRTRIPAHSLLVRFSYQVPAAGSRGAFLKLGRRNAMAISRLTVAALGRLDAAGQIAEARVVAGAAAPQIRRYQNVEAGLLGRCPDADLLARAGRQAAEDMIAVTGRRWSTEYKEPALAALVTRALQQIFTPELAAVEMPA